MSPPVEKEDIKKSSRAEAKEELRQAIQGAQEEIITIKTPLAMFPTSLVMDRSKITIQGGKHGGGSGIITIPIEDVLNVTAHPRMLFGSVKIDKEIVSTENPYHIGPFWKKDAIEFTNTAQGYVIALKRNIDMNALSTRELRDMLKELGQS